MNSSRAIIENVSENYCERALNLSSEIQESARELFIAAGKFNGDIAQVYQAAIQGSAPAQFRLGSMFLKGEEIEINLGQAFYWHHLASQGGHKEAMFQLGWAYRNGLGVAQNDQVSDGWFRRSAKLGYDPAKLEFGMTYLKKLLTQPNSTYRDFLEVAFFLKTSNYQEAGVCLGYLHSAHRDLEAGDRYFGLDYNGGIANVMYELGMKYLLRKEDEDSFRQGLYWLEESGRRNHAHAIAAIGCFYLLQKIRVNIIDDANWFFNNWLDPRLLGNNNVMKQYIKLSDDRSVLVRGHISGLSLYGYLLYRGAGVHRDDIKAREIFLSILRFIDADDSDANMCLGILCSEQQDYVKAMQYFRRSARSVNTYTYNLIADAYRLGLGRERNITKVLYWYNKGGDLGDGYSLFNIGLVLLDLHDGRRHLAQSYFTRAVSCGCVEANTFLD
ncbi:unnamed protein product [Mucor hiemalis]